MKAARPDLALSLGGCALTRLSYEKLFRRGYLVTDFRFHLSGLHPTRFLRVDPWREHLMIISSICLYHLRMPLVAPFGNLFDGLRPTIACWWKRKAETLTGYGECPANRDPGYSYETCDTAWHILKDFLIPAILGREFLRAPATCRTKCLMVHGHPMAKASLEMALWDLLGKSQGDSLADMLGSVRPRVDVGVSVGIQPSPQALVEVVEGYVAQGYRRIKIKIKPGRDVQEAAAVRLRFPDIRLQVDANSAYSLEMGTSLQEGWMI